jgi:hypothetical protein
VIAKDEFDSDEDGSGNELFSDVREFYGVTGKTDLQSEIPIFGERMGNPG